MKTKLPISLLVFATMMGTTACNNQKLSFEPSDIDGFNQADHGVAGDPR